MLCGDFNFKPGDAPYRLITEGTLEKSDPDYPVPREWDTTKWGPAVAYPMRSAYREARGQEPDFTNWAQTRDSEPFLGCLDYLFVSSSVKVEGAAELPSRGIARGQAAWEGPYPTAAQPSDHLPVGATLRLFKGAAEPRGLSTDSKRSANAGELEARLLAFKADPEATRIDFEPSLNSYERLIVHELCEGLGKPAGSKGGGRGAL